MRGTAFRLFYNPVVGQDFGLVFHTVRFRYLPDHLARTPRRKRVGRDVFHNHTARSDYAVVSNGDAGANDNVGAKPTIVADLDRLGITQALYIAIPVEHGISLFRQHRVNWRNDGHVGAKIAVVPDGDTGIVLHRQIVIAKEVRTDLRMASIVEKNWPLHKAALPYLSNNLADQLLPLFCLILIGSVILCAKIVRAQFHTS